MHTSMNNFIHHPPGYPSFLSYSHDHHQYQFNASVNTNVFSIIPNSTLLQSYNTHEINLNTSSQSNTIQHLQSDDDDDSRSKSSSASDMINGSTITFKKRSRVVPVEEKDTAYYEKRTRNNESAKRSRDAKRLQEQRIQERVTFLEHENLRLSMENQTIRYQISQLRALCDTEPRLLQ